MAFKIQQFAYVGMLPIIYTYYFINLLLRFFLIMKYSVINVLTIFFFIESLYSENNVRKFHLSVEMAKPNTIIIFISYCVTIINLKIILLA